MWQTLVMMAFSADLSAAGISIDHVGKEAPRQQAIDQGITGTSRAARSHNFRVESKAARFDARLTAERCEQWRKHFYAKWLGNDPSEPWTPRCSVTIHSHRESYQAAIGRHNDWSFGSSWVEMKAERVSERRIDLLVDSQGELSAFAHELTHVVLADAFQAGQPPLWANEGMAILADSTEKRRLHERDLRQSMHQGTSFRCVELLELTGYPTIERVPAFYGQSASLVAFLNRCGGSEKLVPFLKSAAVNGYDRALSDCYGISGLADLERRWKVGQVTPVAAQ